MSNEELNAILARAEDEYEQMKDRMHDLYDKLNEKGTITFIKRDSLNKWVAKHFNKDLISVDDLIGCIEDLDDEVETLKTKIEDMEQDINDNYKRIDYARQVRE